jgi:hypothetical protein
MQVGYLTPNVLDAMTWYVLDEYICPEGGDRWDWTSHNMIVIGTSHPDNAHTTEAESRPEGGDLREDGSVVFSDRKAEVKPDDGVSSRHQYRWIEHHR